MADWTPQVRRINAADVGEQGKLAFIRSLLGEERFDEAEHELQELLESSPRSYFGNLGMGRLLLRKDQVDRAVTHFETARAANPTQAEAPVLAGTAYLRLNDLERAQAAFQAALEVDAKLASAHVGIAQVHFRRNELDQAEVRLQQALTFDPQLQQARALLARLHNRRGDSDSAMRELGDIQNARPDQVGPMKGMARLHLQRDEPAQVSELLEPVIARYENDFDLWVLLGRAKLLVGDHPGAEEALRKAVALDPRERTLVWQLIESLMPQGKTKEALQILDRLPERLRRSARVHAAYGDVHFAAGHHKRAAESYRAALLRRDDGDGVVNGIEGGQMPARDDADWKIVAERYRANLLDLRRAAREQGETRRPQLRRRQAARAAQL
jgi:tetratricopeptide (TPR) repeat protein